MGKTTKHFIKLNQTHMHEGKIHKRGTVLEVSPKVAKYLADERIGVKATAAEAKDAVTQDHDQDTGGEGGDDQD